MTYGEPQKYKSRSDFFNDRLASLKADINQLSKDEVLNLEQNDYLNYLFDKYSLEPINVLRDSEIVHEPESIKKEVEWPYNGCHYGMQGRKVTHNGYKIKVSYQFTGNPDLFFVYPDSIIISGGASAELEIDHISNRIYLVFEVWEQDAERFQQDKIRTFENKVSQYLTINPEVETFNSQIKQTALIELERRRKEYLAENIFFKAINVTPKQDAPLKITVPTIQKKRVPMPQVGNKRYETYPSMSNEMYEDILTECYKSGQALERKPSLYQGKDEESLRDQFLFKLESRYDNVTATGETFNHCGKTDICLKDATSGANLFIAECKFWHGAQAFHNALDQLFDRYLTIRDTKVALMFFVSGNNFSGVLNTITEEAKKHKYYVSAQGNRGESSFSYIFHLPIDSETTVYLEIMAFHFPKI
ncbi:MAG: hypothetical protein IJ850_09600 [Alistipes sp.]|uniref:hypothetical protein n=1 Tax=Alistipes TaxID=239759 RepID=UPI00101E16CB|nr:MULTISPECIES: hypothetical protein [Alistipes]MBR2218575.1 hypothetical protein [Alistipes sp.]